MVQLSKNSKEVLRTWEADGVNPSLRTGEDEMRCPSSSSEVGKKWAHFSFFHILFYSDLQWTGWCPPTLRRAIYSAESTDSNAYLIWKPSKTHLEIMFNLGTCGQLIDVRLAITLRKMLCLHAQAHRPWRGPAGHGWALTVQIPSRLNWSKC